MPLEKKHVDKIREEIPKVALQIQKRFRDPDSGEDISFIGYKPQYIIEKLNDVWGHDGWDFIVLEKGECSKSVWVLIEIKVYNVAYFNDESHVDFPFKRHLMCIKQQFGHCSYNTGLPISEAYKGAATNALCKCASLLDIGNQAYKGLLTVDDIKANESPEKQFKESFKDLSALCKEYEIGANAFSTLTKTVLGKEINAKEAKDLLSAEEVAQLIKHVKIKKSPF